MVEFHGVAIELRAATVGICWDERGGLRQFECDDLRSVANGIDRVSQIVNIRVRVKRSRFRAFGRAKTGADFDNVVQEIALAGPKFARSRRRKPKGFASRVSSGPRSGL